VAHRLLRFVSTWTQPKKLMLRLIGLGSPFPGQHQERHRTRPLLVPALAVFGPQTQVTLERPAAVAPFLRQPETSLGFVAGFGPEFLPAKLLGLPALQASGAMVPVARQLGGFAAAVGGEVGGQAAQAEHGKAQPTAIKHHDRSAIAPFPSLLQRPPRNVHFEPLAWREQGEWVTGMGLSTAGEAALIAWGELRRPGAGIHGPGAVECPGP
jgi:hypothetical protein